MMAKSATHFSGNMHGERPGVPPDDSGVCAGARDGQLTVRGVLTISRVARHSMEQFVIYAMDDRVLWSIFNMRRPMLHFGIIANAVWRPQNRLILRQSKAGKKFGCRPDTPVRIGIRVALQGSAVRSKTDGIVRAVDRIPTPLFSLAVIHTAQPAARHRMPLPRLRQLA